MFEWKYPENLYWKNPENGYEWYIDNDITKLCNSHDTMRPILNATCFTICKRDVESNKVTPMTRILIDNKTNKILHEDTNLESMGCHVTMLRVALKYRDK